MREEADLVVIPFWDDLTAAVTEHPFTEELAPLLQAGDFKAKQGEVSCVYTRGKEKRVLALGLGKAEKVTCETLRRAFASAMRFAHGKKVKRLAVLVPHTRLVSEETVSSVAEGLVLTNYAFTKLKGEASQKESPTVLVEHLSLIGVKCPEVVEKIQVVAKGIYLVRDWINGNADDITPKMLAELARSLASSTPGLKAHILEKKDLEREKMGLILAVNRASNLDPYLIELSYQGDPSSQDKIALVGKGVTYDTGGLSLKPTDNMLTMKCDMSGGATVLGTVYLAALLKLKVNVTAVVPATENSIGSKSYKLGDVYRSHSGKTVEINNTDAEGRLVLADALSYAIQTLKPTAVVDVATLTGSIIMALGEEMAGLFANDEGLAQDLMGASEKTGEQLWRMPLNPDYKDSLRADFGDLLNTGGRDAGAMKAGLFLQEFVGTTAWAHIDLAGPAYVSRPKHYWPTKATGYGVRLLLEFLERRAHS